MKHSYIKIPEKKSGRPEFGNFILSIRQVTYTSCLVIIGYPGLPNLSKKMELGDVVLYETVEDGILEIRVTKLMGNEVEFLITQISPRLGLIAGALDEDPSNLPFNEIELKRIAMSIDTVKNQLRKSSDFLPEQLDLICRKLDEIQSASQRLGRKDWINYVAGALTSLCITASFSPDVTKTIFHTVNSAFGWLFTNAMLLL